MRLRFLMLSQVMVMIKNGLRVFASIRKMILSFKNADIPQKIAIQYSYSILSCIRDLTVNISSWCLKFWELIYLRS